MSKNVKIFKYCFLAILFYVLFVYAFTFILVNAESKNTFDDTNVIDDLTNSTINGETFSLDNYGYDKNKKISFLTFVEYGYSRYADEQDYYGLYIYVYNPQHLDIETSSNKNKISLSYGDGNTNYLKYNLMFLNKSENDIDGLFYKFKIFMTDTEKNAILNKVKFSERIYKVSEIEIKTKTDNNAVAYSVSSTFKYTGFSKGFGVDVDTPSTLSCKVDGLTTIQLEVKSTYFRSDSSSVGKDHRNQLDSVYFSVPNDILKRYGNLQKIKAEWYEYKTNPIIATSDKEMYDALKPYLHVNIGEHTDNLKYTLGYNHSTGGSIDSCIINFYNWTYNYPQGSLYSNVSIKSDEVCPKLDWLFYDGNNDIGNYHITSDEIKNWYYSHRDFNIMSDKVDNGRTRGYNLVEIDATEEFDLLSYNSDNHSWWDRVGDYGFWATLFGKTPSDDNIMGIKPIYQVVDSDLLGTDEHIASNLLIRQNDVSSFKNYVSNAKSENKTTFLFRFAATDYFSGMLRVEKNYSDVYDNTTYMAQETVFLDFDIIELTFRFNDVDTVIPVVSNPIDIIGGIEPPKTYEGFDWFLLIKYILLIIGILLIYYILSPILRPIWKSIKLIIKDFFKSVSKFFKRLFRKKDR